MGLVWDYNPDARRFTVRFPPNAECDDIGLSWSELLGTAPCLSSTSECAHLYYASNNPPIALITQPRGHRPRDAVWDPRKGIWIDSTGSDYDPGVFGASLVDTHFAPLVVSVCTRWCCCSCTRWPR